MTRDECYILKDIIMTRNEWYILIMGPMVVFGSLTIFIGELITNELLRAVILFPTMLLWLFYTLVMWGYPDAVGGFEK